MLHNELETLLNIQINKELFASYQYLSISSYLKQSSIGLSNLSNYFKGESDNERKHAQMLIDYMISRGSKLDLQEIKIPCSDFSKENIAHDILFIFEKSLHLETEVNEHLKLISNKSDDLNDSNLNDFITSNFLSEQIEAEYELNQYLTKLRMIISDSNANLGILWFDKEFSNH